MHFLLGLLILAVILSIPAGRVLLLSLFILGIFGIGLGLLAVSGGPSSPPATAPAVHLAATPPPPPPHGGACFSHWPTPAPPADAVPLTPSDMPCDPTKEANPIYADEQAAKLVVYRNWLPDNQRIAWERSLDPLVQTHLWNYIRGHAYRIGLKWYVPTSDGTTGEPTPGQGQVDLSGVAPSAPGYADLMAVEALPPGPQRQAYTAALSPAAVHALATLGRRHLTVLTPAGLF